jgi:hypothetical protein
VGQDIGAQFVPDATLIPDGIGQEALHAIGAAFSGLFSELPAIFARHITQDTLEVQEGTMVGWRREQNREQCVRGEIVTRLPNGSRRGWLSLIRPVCYGASASRFSPSLCHLRGVVLHPQHVTEVRRIS